MKFWEILEDCPVIAAIKDEEGLKKSLELDSQIIFLLFGGYLYRGAVCGYGERRG